MAFDQECFNNLLQAAKPKPTGLDLDRVPKRLKELVDDMEAPHKEVYLITECLRWKRGNVHAKLPAPFLR